MILVRVLVKIVLTTIKNTVNASLGPNSPTEFNEDYIQLERISMLILLDQYRLMVFF